VALLQHLPHCVTGVSEGTEQLALGIYQGGRHVRKLSLVKHNYPDHVVKAAEVGSWQSSCSCSCGANVLCGYNFIDALCPARLWVSTVVLLRAQVIHDLTPSCWVCASQRWVGMCCVFLHCLAVREELQM
jgi:hypothetical protein